MKIILFVDQFFAPTQTFLIRKVKALVEKGEQITVVTFKNSDSKAHQELLRGNEKNIRFVYIPEDSGTRIRRILVSLGVFVRAAFKSPKDTFKVWSLTRRYPTLSMRVKSARKLLGLVGVRGDVYHFEFATIAAQYIDFLKSFAKPCIVSFRSNIEWTPYVSRDVERANLEVLEHADRIHCVTNALASRVARQCDPEKIFINHPSIDTSFFAPDSATGREPNLIVTVARLKAVKGLPFALLAVAQLASDFPDLRYVIMGEGPSQKELLFYATDLGIQDHVQFYGRATAEEVKCLLQKASIYLLPSLVEGLSNSVLEAMAMEVPVVTTDAGGMAEAVDDGVEGFVVPRYDACVLAARLRLLLTDAELRRTMGKNGRQRVLRDFTLERQVQVFLDEYYHLASGEN